MIFRVVHVHFVLCLVGSLVHNGIEEVPGYDVQLVGWTQGCLELLPLRSATKDAWGDTFEKKESLLGREKIRKRTYKSYHII